MVEVSIIARQTRLDLREPALDFFRSLIQRIEKTWREACDFASEGGPALSLTLTDGSQALFKLS